jgi:hypothetical protein
MFTYVSIRNVFTKDSITSGKIKVTHERTGKMTADILIKPLKGELLRRIRDWECLIYPLLATINERSSIEVLVGS